DAEHAVEPVEDVRAPLFVAVNDHFGIRLRSETVPPTLELLPELAEVVDLAVEDDPDCLPGIGHGLMASAQVNDGEPAKAEPDRTEDVVALVVRPSVNEGLGHLLHVVQNDRGPVPEIELSANPTHGDQLVACARRKERLRNICD